MDFTNGAIYEPEAALPADTSSVYYNSFFLPGTAGSSMTITFSNPINNFFLNLYNVWITPDTYHGLRQRRPFDDRHDRQQQQRRPVAELVPGGGQHHHDHPPPPTSNPSFDYSIDNIGFNEATPGVPEPAAWACPRDGGWAGDAGLVGVAAAAAGAGGRLIQLGFQTNGKASLCLRAGNFSSGGA